MEKENIFYNPITIIILIIICIMIIIYHRNYNELNKCECDDECKVGIVHHAVENVDKIYISCCYEAFIRDGICQLLTKNAELDITHGMTWQ